MTPPALKYIVDSILKMSDSFWAELDSLIEVKHLLMYLTAPMED